MYYMDVNMNRLPKSAPICTDTN